MSYSPESAKFAEAIERAAPAIKYEMPEPRAPEPPEKRFLEETAVEIEAATELELAEEFARRARGRFRWTPGLDWMVNIGTHWRRDELLSRYTLATEICKQASEMQNDRARARICSASTANAVLTLARGMAGIATPVGAWDTASMVLNTASGPINLETGRAEPMPELLFTQVAGTEARATPTPLWDRFLRDVFSGNQPMIEFIQRLAGYLLTGSIKEQKLFFLHGIGANGKSVFLDALRSVAGSYAHNLPSEALMASRHEGHPTVLASLHGKRLAISSEIEEGAHWAESRIKALTGDETLTARFMRQDFFSFTITHKHLIAGNFKPRLKGDDYAMARRMVLVPFNQRFDGERRDVSLGEKLRAEHPGILAWAVEGARKWAEDGLCIPEAVQAASQAYMAEMDDLRLWIEDCAELSSAATCAVADAYRSFSQWKEANGEHPPSKKSFSQRLERMFTKSRTRSARAFEGFRLRADEPGAYEEASRGF